MSLNYQDDAALLTGDVGRARELAERALSIARPLADYYAVGTAVAHLALATGFEGEIDLARGLMSEVVRTVESADHTAYVPRLAPVLGKLSLWVGEFENAAAWFSRDVQRADPQSPSLIVARSLPGLAEALRRLGRIDEAHERVSQAASIAEQLEMWHLLADALEQAAFLAEIDDLDRAAALHHNALAVRVEHGLRTFYVDSLDALAALAVQAESAREAARTFAASTAARAAMRYPRRPIDEPCFDAALSRVRSMLGDEDFSAIWAEGSSLSLDEAIAYVRRARGTRQRPTTGWASLTPTELDVVRHVVDGLSNPEIGARLFISRGTVKTHLSHIYVKLGVTSRTGLAKIAVTRPEVSASDAAGSELRART
jgi:DNA-binding CsgD family transcriptional regulator